jgi:glutaredoxin-like protein NrdH
MGFTTVEGTDQGHDITLYALSTCGWCRKTKELLDTKQVSYRFIYVDQCEGDERAEVTARVRELNPRGSFPTIEIDGEVVTGFDEDRISELLG